jgi:hypothetical protein
MSAPAASAVDPLLQIALRGFGADAPTTQTVLRVAVILAENVNKMPGLGGRAKLDLVLKTLRDVLAVPQVAERVPDDARIVLRNLIDTVVPDALSLVIEAGRGQFDLKKPSVGCLAKLCGMVCRRAGARIGGDAGAALVSAAAVVDAAVVAVGVTEDKPVVTPPVVAVAVAVPEDKPSTDATVAPPAESPEPVENHPVDPTPSDEKK